MKSIKLIILLAAACSLMACTHKSFTEKQELVSLDVKAGVTLSTKADGGTWTKDEIGIMVIAPDDGEMFKDYKNVGYATEEETSGWATFTALVEPIYFEDHDVDVTFVAYAPYDNSTAANVLPGNDGVISGDTLDQTDGRTEVDYLYSNQKTASDASPGVNFTFRHVMSQIIINLETINDESLEELLPEGEYTLGGVVLEGEFDVNPESDKVGTAYATGNGTEWSLGYWTKTTDAGYPVTFSAIVFPQTPVSMPFSATIGSLNFGGLDLASVLEGEPLEAGTGYYFTITVTRTALDGFSGEITDWNIKRYTGEITAGGGN